MKWTYSNFRQVIFLVFKGIFFVIIAIPFLWIAVSAFKTNDSIFADTAPFSLKTFIPTPFTLEAFDVLIEGNLLDSILFTILIGVMTVVLGILMNSMAGFSFAKLDFPGKKLLFSLVLVSFLVPFEAIIIPLYLTITQLGWNDTVYALIVPALANGLVIFMFRQFFLGIPKELVDAALIDGAGWFRIYSRIFLPLSKPAVISAGLILFLSQWQAFVWPLIAVQTKALRMAQVAIAYMTRDEHSVIWNQFAAASFLISIFPLFIIFPLQRYYVQGITSSGIKG